MTDRPNRVLLVDDDAVVRMVAAALLQRGGYVVTTAADGADALRLIADGGIPDVVVTDLNMPNMSGVELLAALRADASTAATPVIVLTGSEDPAMHAELVAAGARGCIVKPIEARTFLTQLRTALGE